MSSKSGCITFNLFQLAYSQSFEFWKYCCAKKKQKKTKNRKLHNFELLIEECVSVHMYLTTLHWLFCSSTSYDNGMFVSWNNFSKGFCFCLFVCLLFCVFWLHIRHVHRVISKCILYTNSHIRDVHSYSHTKSVQRCVFTGL
jgi:hypothetical protein